MVGARRIDSEIRQITVVFGNDLSDDQRGNDQRQDDCYRYGGMRIGIGYGFKTDQVEA